MSTETQPTAAAMRLQRLVSKCHEHNCSACIQEALDIDAEYQPVVDALREIHEVMAASVCGRLSVDQRGGEVPCPRCKALNIARDALAKLEGR